METSNKILIEFIYFWTFVIFVLSWISIELLARFINNFTFNTLGLDEKSTFQTGVIAFFFILLLVITLFYFRNLRVLEDETLGRVIDSVNSNSSDRNFIESDSITLISNLEAINII